MEHNILGIYGPNQLIWSSFVLYYRFICSHGYRSLMVSALNWTSKLPECVELYDTHGVVLLVSLENLFLNFDLQSFEYSGGCILYKKNYSFFLWEHHLDLKLSERLQYFCRIFELYFTYLYITSLHIQAPFYILHF